MLLLFALALAVGGQISKCEAASRVAIAAVREAWAPADPGASSWAAFDGVLDYTGCDAWDQAWQDKEAYYKCLADHARELKEKARKREEIEAEARRLLEAADEACGVKKPDDRNIGVAFGNVTVADGPGYLWVDGRGSPLESAPGEGSAQPCRNDSEELGTLGIANELLRLRIYRCKTTGAIWGDWIK